MNSIVDSVHGKRLIWELPDVEWHKQPWTDWTPVDDIKHFFYNLNVVFVEHDPVACGLVYLIINLRDGCVELSVPNRPLLFGIKAIFIFTRTSNCPYAQTNPDIYDTLPCEIAASVAARLAVFHDPTIAIQHSVNGWFNPDWVRIRNIKNEKTVADADETVWSVFENEYIGLLVTENNLRLVYDTAIKNADKQIEEMRTSHNFKVLQTELSFMSKSSEKIRLLQQKAKGIFPSISQSICEKLDNMIKCYISFPEKAANLADEKQFASFALERFQQMKNLSMEILPMIEELKATPDAHAIIYQLSLQVHKDYVASDLGIIMEEMNRIGRLDWPIDAIKHDGVKKLLTSFKGKIGIEESNAIKLITEFMNENESLMDWTGEKFQKAINAYREFSSRQHDMSSLEGRIAFKGKGMHFRDKFEGKTPFRRGQTLDQYMDMIKQLNCSFFDSVGSVLKQQMKTVFMTIQYWHLGESGYRIENEMISLALWMERLNERSFLSSSSTCWVPFTKNEDEHLFADENEVMFHTQAYQYFLDYLPHEKRLPYEPEKLGELPPYVEGEALAAVWNTNVMSVYRRHADSLSEARNKYGETLKGIDMKARETNIISVVYEAVVKSCSYQFRDDIATWWHVVEKHLSVKYPGSYEEVLSVPCNVRHWFIELAKKYHIRLTSKNDTIDRVEALADLIIDMTLSNCTEVFTKAREVLAAHIEKARETCSGDRRSTSFDIPDFKFREIQFMGTEPVDAHHAHLPLENLMVVHKKQFHFL